MIRKIIIGLLMLAVFISCMPQPKTLLVMTHDSFAISEDTMAKFSQETGFQVSFLPSGDAGSALNRAILSKGSPVADIIYGIDNTFLSRALAEELFIPYTPQDYEKVPAEFKLDDQARVVPINYGDVCLNYDRAYFETNNLELPDSLQELTAPEYRGMLVVENPATSSPGLAFLLATVAEFGPDGYLDFWQDLKDNEVVVVNDWETAYYTNFSGSVGQGAQPMVVSYGTSPAAEVIFAEQELAQSPTASLTGQNMCYRQIEFAGILAGTENLDAARQFMDFMLSQDFQEDIPMNMFVFPVNPDAVIPGEFLAHIQVPEQPAFVEPEQIAQNREEWIEAWRELMLQ